MPSAWRARRTVGAGVIVAAAVAVLAVGATARAHPAAAPFAGSTTTARGRAPWERILIAHPQLDFFAGVAPGPDRAMYVTSLFQQTLFRIDRATHTVSPLPTHGFYPQQLAADGREHLYATQNDLGNNQPAVAVFGAAGHRLATIGFAPSPSGDTFQDTNLVRGPDGNIWLGEFFHIASIAPNGMVREYPTLFAKAGPNTQANLTVGPDLNIWFTLPAESRQGVAQVGTVDPGTGRVTAHRLPYAACQLPSGIATAGDGNVYVACESNTSAVLVRVSPHFRTSFIPLPQNAFFTGTGNGLATGPDGDLFFSATLRGSFVAYDPFSNRLLRRPAPDGDVTSGVAAGPDGTLWALTDRGVDVYTPSRELHL